MCALRNHRVVAVANLHIVEVAPRRRDTIAVVHPTVIIAAVLRIVATLRVAPLHTVRLHRLQAVGDTILQLQVVAEVAVIREVDSYNS